MRLKVLLVTAFVWLLGACSSPSPISLDRDVWSGTFTSDQGIVNTVEATFKQSGMDVEARITIGQTVNGNPQTAFCCTLKGVLDDKKLELSFLDEEDNSGESIFGTLSDDGKNFTGTIRFTTDGFNEDYSLQLIYQKEAETTQLASR